jgi:hypothetical protein
MNSENLGVRIRENGALDQKIWALEAFRGKMVFLGGFGAILDFFEWLESLGTKYRGSGEIWGFLECLEWFRT